MLRSGDRAGLEQEVWALLTLYQLLRVAMVDAVETRLGFEPDRASFTTALQTARDQLIAAPGTHDHNDQQGIGTIGRAVLATLLPARRPRTSTRKVKCATSRYLYREDRRHRRRRAHPGPDPDPAGAQANVISAPTAPAPTNHTATTDPP